MDISRIEPWTERWQFGTVPIAKCFIPVDPLAFVSPLFWLLLRGKTVFRNNCSFHWWRYIWLHGRKWIAGPRLISPSTMLSRTTILFRDRYSFFFPVPLQVTEDFTSWNRGPRLDTPADPCFYFKLFTYNRLTK